MKKIICLVAAITFYSNLYSQQKKTLYQLEANALINNRNSVYKTGAGIAASAFYPLSPSFSMGPSLSADFLRMQNSEEKYNPLSARLAVVYFPEKLLNSIVTNPNWASIYFKAGLGHSFNYAAITDRSVVNSAYFDLAFMFPLRNRKFNFHAGITTFAIKENNSNLAGNNSITLTTFGVGYNWFKYKK